MKFNPCFMPLAAVLCTSLLFSCTSDLELPPLPPPDNSIESSDNGSSSSGGGSSSSGVSSSGGSSSSVSSSSSGVSSSSGNSSSSSVDLCAGFVDGTKRLHYGMDKKQICDSRDGKKYVYVEIIGQTWMAENLNYNASGSKCGNGNSLSDANTTTCDTYGRLYNWATAMGISTSYNSSPYNPSSSTKYRGVCPVGWHLPSNAEWNALMKFVIPTCSDNAICAGAETKLKASSGWKSHSDIPAGTDDYGFSALPGGYGNSYGSFYDAGSLGKWWSATEDYSSAYNRYISYLFEFVGYYHDDKSDLYSVRCLQD